MHIDVRLRYTQHRAHSSSACIPSDLLPVHLPVPALPVCVGFDDVIARRVVYLILYLPSVVVQCCTVLGCWGAGVLGCWGAGVRLDDRVYTFFLWYSG